MATYGKALLVYGKALPVTDCKNYDQAMLSTSERMAQKLNQALKEKGLTQTAFATLCGASKQTVHSWKKTGRIDKMHLQKFVEILGHPLEWWLEVEQPQTQAAHAVKSNENPAHKLNGWPFTSVSKSEYDRLTERQRGMVEGYIKGILSEGLPVKSDHDTKAA